MSDTGRYPSGTPRAGLRALVVDDHLDAAETLAMFLDYVGIDSQTAVDGQQALALATEWHPHIGIFDIRMPGLDGVELARQIRAQNWESRPLLIAVTGWGDQVRESALSSGFDHWAQKPVEPMSLVRMIQGYFQIAAT
jgi:CheY-like chemotaxis protein